MAAAAAGGVREVGDVKLLARAVEGVETKDLKSLVDDGKKQIGSGVVAIVGVTEDGKAGIVVGVTADLTSRFNAVELVRKGSEALGGKGGGGRPDMAQAGGPDGAKADAALSAIEKAMAANGRRLAVRKRPSRPGFAGPALRTARTRSFAFDRSARDPRYRVASRYRSWSSAPSSSTSVAAVQPQFGWSQLGSWADPPLRPQIGSSWHCRAVRRRGHDSNWSVGIIDLLVLPAILLGTCASCRLFGCCRAEIGAQPSMPGVR